MEIICHRGLWEAPNEKNTRAAFERAFQAGFGVETDIRDSLGELVISHDPPLGGEMRLAELFAMHAAWDHPGVLALNIKSDGLRLALEQEASRFPNAQLFAFDMSVPDLRTYVGGQISIFTRQSELEPDCVLYAEAQGVWLDAFHSTWYPATLMRTHLSCGKRVCVVSPELHGRNPEPLWRAIVSDALHSEPAIMICTDRAHEACQFLKTGSDATT